jgi:hypothetical protein
VNTVGNNRRGAPLQAHFVFPPFEEPALLERPQHLLHEERVSLRFLFDELLQFGRERRRAQE